MNHTSHPNERNSISTLVRRSARDRKTRAPRGGHSRRGLSRRLIALIAVLSVILAALIAGCAPTPNEGAGCTRAMEALPASRAASLIAVIPRTSAEAASWGLRELALLLPFAARAGLELHVIYTQDSDDLGEGGGDGGPSQVLETQAPDFPGFQVDGAPQASSDPNALTAKLYCERLATWQSHASRAVADEAARQITMVGEWARSTAARLVALASRPIPDTTGREADVEFDAAASIFSAAQVALTSPRPTILVLGGLTAVAPPAQSFEVPAHLVILVRSTDPTQVLQAEAVWSRWVTKAGGTFRAISANDSPTVITSVLAS